MHEIRNLKVCVKKASKKVGLGVFALKRIKLGDTIEVCPLVLFPAIEMKIIEKTRLNNYYFDFDDNNYAVVLGFGSLYNHSYKPNARFTIRKTNKTVIFRAIKDISPNEEIFINYNGNPKDTTPLEKWYDSNFVDLITSQI